MAGDYAIRIKTAINNNEAKSKLQQLTAEAQSTAKQLASLDKQISTIKGNTKLADSLKAAKDEAAATAQQLDEVNAKLEQMKTAEVARLSSTPGFTNMSASTLGQVAQGNVQSANPELVGQSDTLAASLSKADAAVEQLSAKYTEQQSTLSALENQHASLSSQFEKEIAALKEESAAQDQSAASAKRMADTKKRVNSAFSSFGNTVNKNAASVGNSVSAQASKSFDAFGNGFKKTEKLASYMSGRLKRIIFGALIFNAVSAAFRSLATYMQSALNQSDAFKNAMSNLKGAALTAVAPLMQALTPALTAIANAAAVAFSYIAKLVSLLTGKSVGAMKAFAASTNKAAAAAKSATLSIDELNVVDQGSGSGDTSAPNFNFDGQSALIDGILSDISNKFKVFGEQFTTLFAPSIAAWGDAWNQIQAKTVEVLPQVQTALSTLWHEHVEPLAAYLASDFAPTVANSFSEAFAPIYGDVLSGELEASANYIAWYGGLIGDVMDNIVKPALEAVKNIWSDMMGGIQSTWQEYGAGLVEGAIALFQNLQSAISNVYETVLKPVIVFLIDKIQQLWDDSLKPLWDNLLGFFADVGAYLLAGWNNIILPIFNGLVDLLGPFIAKALEVFLSKVKLVIGVVADTFNIIITVLRGILQFFTNVFQGNWQGAWDAIKKTVVNVWDAIVRLIKNAVNGVIGIVNGMIAAVVAGLNTVIGLANRLTYTVPKWVPVIGGSTWGLNIPTINAPQIPYLAQGAVIPANSEFMAVLGDQTSGTNIEAPLDTIKQAVAEVLGQGGGQDINLTVETTLDGEVIYRNQRKVSARKGYQMGGNPSFA